MLFIFPRDFLDEIWDLIGSVSDGFLPTLVIALSFYRTSLNHHATHSIIACLRGASIGSTDSLVLLFVSFVNVYDFVCMFFRIWY